MDTGRLIYQVQQLKREEKLKVFRQLAKDLSFDVDPYFEGRQHLIVLPPIRATDQAIKQLEDLERATHSDV